MPDPVVADDLVCMSWAYDPSFYPAGFLLRLTEGGTRLVWKTPGLVTVGPAPVILDGYIYTLHYGLTQNTAMPIASLQCLDLDTGEVVWEELGERREGKMLTLTAAKKTLIILDDMGTLFTAEASPDGFKEIAWCDVLQGAAKSRCFWTPPVLCNAKIYCRNYAGDLVCIDVSR